MKRHILRFSAVVFSSAGMIVLASCSEEKAPPTAAAAPQYTAVTTTQPGVAGGVYQETYTVEAIVSAVDLPTRRVTLKGPAGDESTFTAGPEIKNLPQLHVGDTVTATFARRMSIIVGSADSPPISSYTALDATANPGQKPQMLVAADTTKVARVTAIDSVNRTADLKFVDGVVKNVPIRSDVDLSRYKVGDNVVIQVTAALSVIAETPKP